MTWTVEHPRVSHLVSDSNTKLYTTRSRSFDYPGRLDPDGPDLKLFVMTTKGIWRKSPLQSEDSNQRQENSFVLLRDKASRSMRTRRSCMNIHELKEP